MEISGVDNDENHEFQGSVEDCKYDLIPSRSGSVNILNSDARKERGPLHHCWKWQQSLLRQRQQIGEAQHKQTNVNKILDFQDLRLSYMSLAHETLSRTHQNAEQMQKT